MAGRSVAIPDDFWALFERVEGRSMPPSRLEFPRIDWG
jgi:hypothetical protein